MSAWRETGEKQRNNAMRRTSKIVNMCFIANYLNSVLILKRYGVQPWPVPTLQQEGESVFLTDSILGSKSMSVDRNAEIPDSRLVYLPFRQKWQPSSFGLSLSFESRDPCANDLRSTAPDHTSSRLTGRYFRFHIERMKYRSQCCDFNQIGLLPSSPF